MMTEFKKLQLLVLREVIVIIKDGDGVTLQ